MMLTDDPCSVLQREAKISKGGCQCEVGGKLLPVPNLMIILILAYGRLLQIQRTVVTSAQCLTCRWEIKDELHCRQRSPISSGCVPRVQGNFLIFIKWHSSIAVCFENGHVRPPSLFKLLFLILATYMAPSPIVAEQLTGFTVLILITPHEVGKDDHPHCADGEQRHTERFNNLPKIIPEQGLEPKSWTY